MLSAVFCVMFGVSLLPGRTPLCQRFAQRISGGIMPDGAEEYCRRLTWVWFFLLLFTTTLAILDWRLSLATPAIIALTFLVEGRVRRRRFSVTFHTSGSTGGPKTIVKTFESLAREVDCHRAYYRAKAFATRPRFLATIEPGHMYGTLWRVMLPKAMDCEVDPDVILTPEGLVAKMKASASVFLVTTPSFLERFTAYAAQYDVPQNCVEITTSGGLLRTDVARRVRKVFGIVPREIFGSTETGGVAWRRQEKGGETWQVFDAVKVSVGENNRLVVRSPYCVRRGAYMMGDAVEMLPGGRGVRLLGRVDRLVKINEERVNLAEMEEKVRALGFRDCALAVIDGERGPIVGALLVAAEHTAGKTPLELRAMMLPVFPKGTVPKRFRYVQQLPRNAQGKVVAAEVRARLDSALIEPDARDVVIAPDSFSAILSFREDAPYFRGHFPGFPVLPGVAQLGFAAQWAAILVGDATRKAKAVKKMKFSQIIRPGDEVSVRLTRRGEAEVAYEYAKGNETCSSGVLLF